MRLATVDDSKASPEANGRREKGGGSAEERLVEVEQELRRVQSRLAELTRTVASGVATVDLTGAVREINSVAAEILGVPVDDVIGRHFRDFVSPEDLHYATELFASRVEGDMERRVTELHIVRPTGERRLVEVCSSALVDEHGVVGVYFAARDLTEERSREVQLRRAERLASLAPLLGGVCHELNNPLTSIKSFAELMLLDERPPEDVEALEIVRREAARAARIVTDLKLVARQSQEDGNLAFLQINDLIEQVFATAREECRAAGIEIDLQLASDLPQICGSKAQLERLLAQLLSNAVQILAEHDGPRRIEARTFRCELGIAVRICDSGTGIHPDHVERIFDPFWTTRTTGEGTGLGLSLAHGIATDHKGRIVVDGGWGTGASFTVELPTSDPPPSSNPEAPVQAPSRSPLRILIVDDEGPIRYTMMRYMSRRGHTIMEAEEGMKALALIESAGSQPFDIILADLRMPGLGGEQLYRRLQERGDGLEERLIFITGDAEGPDAADFINGCGVPVVLKPFELAEIAQIIEAQADVVKG